MATIVPRSTANSASFAPTIASSSADGSPTALPAVVATQGDLLIFPSHTKSKSEQIISSAEATQIARDRLAFLSGEAIPAPASDGGSADGPPPAKAGRLTGPDLMDLSAAATPEIIHESQKILGTPPTAW